jgi:hypothetical protein
MGQWQESLFPEDNAANYVNGRCDPKAAEALRADRRKREAEARLQAETRTIAQQHRPQRAAKA